jgi:hypothetical protein
MKARYCSSKRLEKSLMSKLNWGLKFKNAVTEGVLTIDKFADFANFRFAAELCRNKVDGKRRQPCAQPRPKTTLRLPRTSIKPRNRQNNASALAKMQSYII